MENVVEEGGLDPFFIYDQDWEIFTPEIAFKLITQLSTESQSFHVLNDSAIR